MRRRTGHRALVALGQLCCLVVVCVLYLVVVTRGRVLDLIGAP